MSNDLGIKLDINSCVYPEKCQNATDFIKGKMVAITMGRRTGALHLTTDDTLLRWGNVIDSWREYGSVYFVIKSKNEER